MTHAPTNIPESHLAAIGRIANNMAQLEFQIDLGIWTLIGANQQLTACLTAQFISPIPRLKAFTGLCEVLGGSPDSIAKLNTFSGSLSGLIEWRNRLLHDPRMIKKRTRTVARLQITAKPKVHFGFIDESIADINKIIEKIGNSIKEFINLRDNIISEIESLTQKSPPQLSKIVPALD